MRMLLSKLKNNSIFSQSIVLLISTILGMVVLLFSNFFLTKLISPKMFGDYSYVLNVFNLFQTIFNFGFFYSINRQVVLSRSEFDIRQSFGLGLLFIVGLSIPMIIVMYIFTISSIEDSLIRSSLFLLIPFSVLSLMINFNELILQGGNKIKALSLSRILPKFLYFLTIISIYFIFVNKYEDYTIYLIIYFLCLLISHIVIISIIKPIFSGVTKRMPEILKFNKEFGFSVYLGALISLGASSLNGILIGEFGTSNLEVGYYAIALQFTAPLTLIPNVIATASYKSFSENKKINKNQLVITIVISIVSLIFMLTFCEWIVKLIYGVNYIQSTELIRISSIGAVLFGLSDYFNRFLLANGQGKKLRNTSFFVGISMIISCIILIPIFNGLGASLSYLFAGLVYLSVIIFQVKNTNLEEI